MTPNFVNVKLIYYDNNLFVLYKVNVLVVWWHRNVLVILNCCVRGEVEAELHYFERHFTPLHMDCKELT